MGNGYPPSRNSFLYKTNLTQLTPRHIIFEILSRPSLKRGHSLGSYDARAVFLLETLEPSSVLSPVLKLKMDSISNDIS